MISLKALYDTIDRFEKMNLFIANTIYIPDKFIDLAPDLTNKFKYVVYNSDIFGYNILFIGRNVHDTEEILSDEEFIIKGIIE